MGLLDLIGHKYPFTDFHELNLDWCISAVLQLQKAFEDFSAGNKLIFANPLQHDLTKTYAKNTVVVDENGTAYLSLEAVPVGVQLTNTDYWLPVFDFAGYVTRANQNLTDNYFSGTDRAPHALAVGDWVVLDDVLYKVIVAMAADDLFIIGTNIIHFTVEQFLKDFITSVNNTLASYSLTIQQYKNDIDASELLYRQQLAQDIADTTASLQAQLDAVIAGATVDSEVIAARVGADGVTYTSLGDNIRTVDTHLFNQLEWFKDDDIYYSGNLLSNTGITDNVYMTPSTGAIVANTDYYTTDFIPVTEDDVLRLYRNDSVPTSRNIGAITLFDAWCNLIPDTVRNVTEWTVTSGVHYIRLSIKKDSVALGVGVLVKQIGSAWPTMLPRSRDGVLAQCVTGLKTAYPLSPVSYEKNGNDITITCGSRFLLSDNVLTNVISQTLTLTLPATITGVAVNKETEQLVTVTPTTIYPSDRYYFIGIWYQRKLIYDPSFMASANYDNTDIISNGKLFLWLSGDHLFVSGTNNLLMVYNRVVQSTFVNTINAGQVKAIQLDDENMNSLRYIFYDGSDIKVSPLTSYAANDNVIVLGHIYHHCIFAYHENIIANRMPIGKIKQRTGIPTFINFERLGYEVVPNLQNANDANIAYFGNTIRVTDAFNMNQSKFPFVRSKDELLCKYTTVFEQNTASISGKKILTVGDSITKRGYYQKVISDHENGVIFVGTQTSNYYNIPCEGYSGQSMPTVLGPTGPFYNPNTQELDFNYYCGINNIDPDIVVVLFGLNDSEAPYEFKNYMQSFIDSIHTYDPDVDVYVIIPFGEATDAWYGAGSDYFGRRNLMILYQAQCYDLDDCTLIPAYYIIDDKYDYGRHDVSYGVGSVTVSVIDDGVHPAEATGFKKIGDMVYNYLI